MPPIGAAAPGFAPLPVPNRVRRADHSDKHRRAGDALRQACRDRATQTPSGRVAHPADEGRGYPDPG